jgi:hypothetical protein
MCSIRSQKTSAALASPKSKRKGRPIHHKVRSLEPETWVSSWLTIVEGPALGVAKAALGFGGAAKGKEEL